MELIRCIAIIAGAVIIAAMGGSAGIILWNEWKEEMDDEEYTEV